MNSLGALKPGESAIVEKIGTLPPSFRESLYAMGVMPGSSVKFVRKAPLGDPMQIEVQGTQLSIRNADAKEIFIQAEQQA